MNATIANIVGDRISEEAMHSNTVILPMRVRIHFLEANIFVVPWFAGHRTIEMFGLVAPKV